MAAPSASDYDILSSPDKRSGVEERWVSFQPYLLSKGYRLRPRYQPDWVPSWTGTTLRPTYCEDSIDSMPVRVLDAIRIVDECQVIIKMLVPQQGGEGDEELEILQYFSSTALKDHPSNHVVPCLEAFPIPGVESGRFIVMPLLGRYDEPPFNRLAEVHDFLQQMFEGLLFMHANHTVHCDIASTNIMMDSRPLYDEPFHPVYQTLSLDIQRVIHPRYARLTSGVRYYFIDMGYATRFRDMNISRFVIGKRARIMAPEQNTDRPYDPFLLDTYQLGTVIKQDIIPMYTALDFLKPLAEEMTRSDPSARPTLVKAKQSMNMGFLGLSGVRYRWPLIPREAGFRARGIYLIWGAVSEIRYWLQKLLRLFLRLRI